jgi:hypothetical protein
VLRSWLQSRKLPLSAAPQKQRSVRSKILWQSLMNNRSRVIRGNCRLYICSFLTSSTGSFLTDSSSYIPITDAEFSIVSNDAVTPDDFDLFHSESDADNHQNELTGREPFGMLAAISHHSASSTTKPLATLMNQNNEHIQPIEGFDYQFIFDSISSCTSPIVGDLIARYLVDHQLDGPISNCRASVLHSLTAGYDRWPVFQWNEGDIEVIKIFNINDEYPSCNWLAHYGCGKHSTRTGKEWKRSAICWSVGDTRGLRSLVVASQHLLGSLQLPSSQRGHIQAANGSLKHNIQERRVLQTADC